MLQRTILLLLVSLCFKPAALQAQKDYWNSGQPFYFLFEGQQGAEKYETTNLAPVMQNYNDNLYIAWTGEDEKINVKLIGESLSRGNSNLQAANFKKTTLNHTTSFAPSLAYAANRLFLFFRDKKDGNKIKYTSIAKSGEKFTTTINTLNLSGSLNEEGGLYACQYSDNSIFITWTQNSQLQYAICSISNGMLKATSQSSFNEQALGTASACYLGEQKTGIAWTGTNKDNSLNFIVFEKGKFGTKKIYNESASSSTPVVYKKWNRPEIRLVWKGKGDDNKIWQGVFTESDLNFKQQPASGNYTIESTVAPSVAHVDDNNYIMIWKGTGDKRFNIAYQSTYQYEKWMEQTITDKNVLLKDISIPGAHDAAMSETNYCTIGANKCNTVTQIYSIKEQMKKGIRYFDLRPSNVKDGEMYSGHYANDYLGCSGETMNGIFSDVIDFLNKNNKEFVILNITHLRTYDKDITDASIKKLVQEKLSSRLFIKPKNDYSINDLQNEKIESLRGKVIISSDAGGLKNENYIIADVFESGGNQREYVGTNNLDKLITEQEKFVKRKNKGYTRLDWQVTQVAEAVPCALSFIHCADGFRWSFSQVFKTVLECGVKGVVVFYAGVGYILPDFVLSNSFSILRMASSANTAVRPFLYKWIDNGAISKSNRINIVYADIADTWVTDVCIDMNAMLK